MDKENKKNGKIKNAVAKVNQKVKTFIGTHMWIKDAALLGAGYGVGKGVELIVKVAKEVAKEAAATVIEVPEGTIEFHEN